MKIGILTAYTDINPWTIDEKCNFLKVSSQNHIEYCIQNNYSYICELFHKEKLNSIHPTWIKIFALLKYLNEYDYLVWIDADCVFKDKNKKIEDFITPKNVDLIICKHGVDKTNSVENVWNSINTGFMIFKNSEWSLNLLKSLIFNWKNFKNDYFHEQSVLDNYLLDNGYYNNNDILLKKQKSDLTDLFYEKNVLFLPYRYHVYYLEDECHFVYHAAGNSITKSDRLIKFLKNNA